MPRPNWIPPEDPDPSEILHSAVADKRNGLYSEALAKYLWFHHNALKYGPGQGGVRLSFALGYWLDLAAVYLPARHAFIYTRDETEAAFRESPDFESFHDLASFNARLGESLRTADLFAMVAAKNHEAASRLYHVAEPHLIAHGRYAECGPFLNPEKRMAMTTDCYRVGLAHEESRPQSRIPIPKFARRRYMEDVSTLVALLVINGRTEEARTACAQGLAVTDDDEFRGILDAAMTGHFPDPPPY